jgi:hypothetical protein
MNKEKIYVPETEFNPQLPYSGHSHDNNNSNESDHHKCNSKMKLQKMSSAHYGPTKQEIDSWCKNFNYCKLDDSEQLESVKKADIGQKIRGLFPASALNGNYCFNTTTKAIFLFIALVEFCNEY